MAAVSLYQMNLIRRQPIEFIHQPVNLPIGRRDLALQRRLFVRRLGGGVLAMQLEPLFDQCDL